MVKKCSLCESSTDNERELGEFMETGGIYVHYYCLLLSTQLIQNGEDDEGAAGFLKKDILIEKRRIKKQKCFYCKKNSANIICCYKNCLRSFHLVCGLDKCLFEFIDTFRSFCHSHHNINESNKHKNDDVCSICYDEMQRYHPITSIKAVCCQNGWFHKSCVTTFAKTAGYFFKCPLCNNTDIFRDYVIRHGVFVPDQDAAWELEPNAFSELLERPNDCQADKCICPHSREYKNYKWKIFLCKTCGSFAAHNFCWKNITGGSKRICDACIAVPSANSFNIETDHVSAIVSSNAYDKESDNTSDNASDIASDNASENASDIESDSTDTRIIISDENESSDENIKHFKKINKNHQIIESYDEDSSENDIKDASRKILNSDSSSNSTEQDSKPIKRNIKERNEQLLASDSSSDSEPIKRNIKERNEQLLASDSSSDAINNGIKPIIIRNNKIFESDSSSDSNDDDIKPIIIRNNKIFESDDEFNDAFDEKCCYLCNSSAADEIHFGKLLKLNKLFVHHNCILLTRIKFQVETVKNCILKCNVDEVALMANYFRKQICYICHFQNANVRCAKKKCSNWFHMKCGIEKCSHEYVDPYNSYCQLHVEVKSARHLTKEICCLCRNSMEKFNKITSINPICCKRGWFHKNCVARYAKGTGSLFKCPLCNDKEAFRQNMAKCGINISITIKMPRELDDPHIFTERQPICAVKLCFCPISREYQNNEWKLVACKYCGSFKAHVKCWENTSSNLKMICSKCDIKNKYSKCIENFKMEKSNTVSHSNSANEPSFSGKKLNLRCNLEKCLCPKSREFSDKNWEFVYCKSCHKFFAHTNCWKSVSNHKFICLMCKSYDISNNEVITEKTTSIESTKRKYEDFFRNVNMTEVPIDNSKEMKYNKFSNSNSSSSGSSSGSSGYRFHSSENEIAIDSSNSFYKSIQVDSFFEEISNIKSNDETHRKMSIESVASSSGCSSEIFELKKPKKLIATKRKSVYDDDIVSIASSKDEEDISEQTSPKRRKMTKSQNTVCAKSQELMISYFNVQVKNKSPEKNPCSSTKKSPGFKVKKINIKNEDNNKFGVFKKNFINSYFQKI